MKNLLNKINQKADTLENNRVLGALNFGMIITALFSAPTFIGGNFISVLLLPLWIYFLVGFIAKYMFIGRDFKLSLNPSKQYSLLPKPTAIHFFAVLMVFLILLFPSLFPVATMSFMESFKKDSVKELTVSNGDEAVKLSIPSLYYMNIGTHKYNITTLDNYRFPIKLAAQFPSFSRIELASITEGIEDTELVKISFYKKGRYNYKDYMQGMVNRFFKNPINYSDITKSAEHTGKASYKAEIRARKSGGRGGGRYVFPLETVEFVIPNTPPSNETTLLCYREVCEMITKIKPLSIVTVKFPRVHVEQWNAIRLKVTNLLLGFIE